mgnify:CR=1 FL=1|tara:strand:- start:1015 stop:1413 length:399 start_codon:yes stop_codon:yes gene_type:complete
MNNIQEIACKIYSGSPRSPQSIQLELPESSPNNDLTQEIFNIVLEIFHYGMVKFHGIDGKVDLNQVTEDDFLKMRQYFWSFGFEIFYKISDNSKLLLENKEYDKPTELFKKYITLSTNILKYEISFDYYQSR